MNILLTKLLSAKEMDLIRIWGWRHEVTEVLRVNPVEVIEIPEAEAWIVSSRNSFHAVKKFKDGVPEFVYCVGSWTKDQLTQLGVKATALSFENMKTLVTHLKEQNIKSILYFCGEEHRGELEKGLRNRPVEILKVITHRSRMTFPVVGNKFDAVFVFSPRGAESLLKCNVFDDQTIFACIGSTTASYLKDRGITNTFAPSYPDARVLLEEFHHQILNPKFQK
ncbi:MAG TPA: uroporphyrinogen-III synthase [Cyclobacteriaceae bacterium]|nr:uroporphyrinogen-III synthase [Cyclobacteriaceae bacterium]